MSQAIVTQPAGTSLQAGMATGVLSFVTNPAMVVEGVETLNKDDIIFPRYKLIQPTSQDLPDEAEAHVGHFYDMVFGDYYANPTGVLLSLAKGRSAFDRQYGGAGRYPICKSANSIYPLPEYIGKELVDTRLLIQATISNGPCTDCPFSQFGPNKEAPLCAKNFSFAMLNPTSRLPFVVTFKRTAASVGKQLNTVAMMAGRARIIKLTTKKVVNEQGKYYVPVMSLGEETPQDLLDIALSLSQLGAVAAQTAVSEDDETTEEGGAFGGAPIPPEPPDTFGDMPF